ncbi:tetratricopeptide repeat protein [Acidithiobacillus montserratensis]|uniref:Tetratricopeptide repeat protein n=1 Tax=Acidithiobacillus montserratensis TaxID=2729135 RepID=A0ACD5HGP5_9PROT|nr:tetratricopeptide repeat protein [Acidithiobacillus montserratensis]MBU2749150.1 tetratricopeptide repeat protein [Acidithiobacillus montserratensis]
MSILPNNWLLHFHYRQTLRELLALLLRFGTCGDKSQRAELARSARLNRRKLQDLRAIDSTAANAEAGDLSELWQDALCDLRLEGWQSYQYQNLEKHPWSLEQVQSEWFPQWDLVQEAIGEAILLPDITAINDDEAFLRTFIQDNPEHAQAYGNLGVCLMDRGDEFASEKIFRHALKIDPDHSDALLNFAVLLTRQKRLDESENLLKHALEVRPDYLHAYCNLGFVLSEQKRYAESEAVLHKALDLQPDSMNALVNITVPLFERKAYAEAEKILRSILRQDPDHRGAALNLVACLYALGKKDDGEITLRETIERFPDFSDAMIKLALVLADRDDIEEAYSWFQRAYEVSANDPTIGFDFSLFALSIGRYVEGFRLYELRFEAKENYNPIRFPERERWDGKLLQGKRILVHAEQGLGDLIQMVRYVAELKKRGGQVILETREPLLRLFSCLEDVEEVFLENTEIPSFDVFAPIMSLPHLCGTTVSTIPNQAPYLTVDEQWIAQWAPKLPAKGLRVGVVWASNPLARNGQERSLPLVKLAPLANIVGLHLVSLQKGESAEAQIEDVNFPLLPLGTEIVDFADTAAIISQLDLVLTVDTAVAHLSGALNVPTWVILSHDGDWRWLRKRSDSPWYPSIHLFRQPAPGDWDGLLLEVLSALNSLLLEQTAKT